MNESLPSRILYPNNPKAPNVLVTFNRMTNEAIRLEMVSQLVVHFEHDGATFLQDSDEFKQQEDIQQERQNNLRKIMEQHKIGSQNYMGYNNQDEAFNLKNQKEARKIMRNKFNY